MALRTRRFYEQVHGMSSPLESKKAPPARVAGAILIGTILAVLWYQLLHYVVDVIEGHHGLRKDNSRLMLPLCIISLPLGTAIAIALVIPLGVYLTDYAAFQDLNVIRPDHYARLVFKVHKAWVSSNGKLSSKEI